VSILSSIDQHLVRPREDLRVAVCRWERQQNHLALSEGASADGRFLGDLPCHGHWRIGSQELFYRNGHQRGLFDQPVAIIPVLGKMPKARADGAPRRVDARYQKKAERPKDVLFGKGLIFHSSPEQERNEIFSTTGAAMGNLSPEVLVHFMERLAKGGIIRNPIMQKQSHPVSECVAIAFWQSQHMRYDSYGNMLRVVCCSIATII